LSAGTGVINDAKSGRFVADDPRLERQVDGA
jgi:hypothetical protein